LVTPEAVSVIAHTADIAVDKVGASPNPARQRWQCAVSSSGKRRAVDLFGCEGSSGGRGST